MIAEGEVDIQIDPSLFGEQMAGERTTIATLRRGESFGEIALVDENLRSASAYCAQNQTRLIVIPREALMWHCVRSILS